MNILYFNQKSFTCMFSSGHITMYRCDLISCKNLITLFIWQPFWICMWSLVSYQCNRFFIETQM